MKIVSNVKDYYDHCVEKFGIDEKAFYHRVPETSGWHFSPPGAGTARMVAFCGKFYVCAKYGRLAGELSGKTAFGPDIDVSLIPSDPWDGRVSGWDGAYRDEIVSLMPFHGRSTTINEKAGSPIVSVVLDRSGVFKESKTHFSEPFGNFRLSGKDFRLSDLGFASAIPAEDAFVSITNFLLREKASPSKMTDPEKVASHGFDLKRSFRPKMK